MLSAPSELARHCERDLTPDGDDAWVTAGDKESVESFLTRAPPSFMDKAWIAARHDGLTRAAEEYYTKTETTRSTAEEIKEAWEAVETKSTETLTATLKENGFGCGKFMLFVPAAEVDALWRRIVTALWEGALGSFAKVSGSTPESNGSHVIYVYAEPFWEVAEVERVLRGLREDCGVHDALKFKSDGASLLGLAKGNEHGIPPSIYAAPKRAVKLNVQKSLAEGWGGKEWGGRPEGEVAATEEPAAKNTWVRREAAKPAPRRAQPPTTEENTPKVRPMSAFAALAGAADGDADAIVAGKKEKQVRRIGREGTQRALSEGGAQASRLGGLAAPYGPSMGCNGSYGSPR